MIFIFAPDHLPPAHLFRSRHETDHEFTAVDGAGFVEDVLEVAAHCPERDPELTGDAAVALTGDDSLQDFVLAR